MKFKFVAFIFFFSGDLMNEDSVLSYLTDLESMEVPNAIEEVNAKVLQNIIDETEHVAVLFYGKIFFEVLLFIHFLI